MPAPKVLILLSLISLTGSEEIKTMILTKCCWYGMQYDSSVKACVNVSGSEVSDTIFEVLSPPIDGLKHQWIPPSLRSYKVLAFFSTISDITLDVTEEYEYTDENWDKGFKDFHMKIDSQLITRETLCFDVLSRSASSRDDHPLRRIQVKSVSLHQLNKCCSIGKTLVYNTYGLQCSPENTQDEYTEKEIRYVKESPPWLPGNYSNQILNLNFNVEKTYFNFFDVVSNLSWRIVHTPPLYPIKIQFLNQDFSGKGETGYSDNFCFDKVNLGQTSRIVLWGQVSPKMNIWKCCAFGKQYDINRNKCVPSKNEDGNDNMFSNWISKEYIHMQVYNKTSNILHDLPYADIVVFKDSFQFLGRKNYGKPIYPLMIRMEDLCLDRTAHSFPFSVVMKRHRLKPILKCCAKGERLRAGGGTCEAVPHLKNPQEGTSIVNEWLPAELDKYTIAIEYDALQNIFPFNIVIPTKSALKINITNSPTDYFAFDFEGRNASGSIISGITNAVCFDEVEEGPLSPRVMLAALYHAKKCCPKGAHITTADGSCMPYFDRNIDDVKSEVIQSKWNSTEMYWIPDAIQQDNIYVMYDAFDFHGPEVIFVKNESLWYLNYNAISYAPILSFNISTTGGKLYLSQTSNYCYDHLLDTGKVVVWNKPPRANFVTKCCYPGEILSPAGTCIPHSGQDWSPGLSNFSHLFPPNTVRELTRRPLKYRGNCSSFEVISTRSARAQKFYKGEDYDILPFSVRYFCADWQTSGGDVLVEAVANLQLPLYAGVYALACPLGAATAALAAGAAAAGALARADTRRSAHGRALASHALSLTFAHALQLASFVHQPTKRKNCLPYASITYFFMIAANLWLTIITFNMFRNFRQPLGALAPARSSGGGGGRRVWVRFGFMSLGAWGGATLFTALAVVMYQNGFTMFMSGYTPPTFVETRTCMNEIVFIRTSYKNFGTKNALGSVFYYYVPSALLAATNIILMVLTVRGMRRLKRGTSILRRDAKKETSGAHPQRHVMKALLYAKLLLTTGLLELALESILMWTVGRRRDPWGSHSQQMCHMHLFPILASVLDVLRAASVLCMVAGRLMMGMVISGVHWLRGRLMGASQEEAMAMDELPARHTRPAR